MWIYKTGSFIQYNPFEVQSSSCGINSFFLFYCQVGFLYMDVPVSLSTYLLKEFCVVFSFWRWWTELIKNSHTGFWVNINFLFLKGNSLKSGVDESYGKHVLNILRHWSGCALLNLHSNVWVLYCFTSLPKLGVLSLYSLNFIYFHKVGGSISLWFYFAFNFNKVQFVNFLFFYGLCFHCHVWEFFISSSFLKDIFTGHRILSW